MLTISLLFLSAVLLIPAVIFASRCVKFYRTQPHMLYHPHHSVDIRCGDTTIDHEEIFYRTADGIKISAWYVPHKPGKALPGSRDVVLFCHGNAGDISRRIDSFRIFRRLGLSTFIFDYRGYGKSGGSPTEKGTYRDADGAWNYLVAEMKIKPGNIIVFGRSLGGGPAAYLAWKYRPKALIIESSYISIPELASGLFRGWAAKLLTRYRYNTRARLKNLRCPVLIVHSPDDTLIPFYHGQVLYEAANPPKSFLRITGDHTYGFLESGDIYVAGLKKFVSECRAFL